MIRKALSSDKGRVIELLRDSRLGAGFDRPEGFTFPFDPAYAARLFDLHTTRPQLVCLIYVTGDVAQGVLMAAAFEHPFGPVRLAKETVWWIDPAHRGGTAAVRMLDAYEAWAREQRCTFIGMAGMGDEPAVGRLYERRGYVAAETHFLKVVS